MCNNLNSIGMLEKAVKFLRNAVAGDMGLQQVLLFIEVAKHGDDGITQTDLSDILRLSQAVVSRNCRMLARIGKVNSRGERIIVGHDLVEMRPDIFEGRRLNVRLTTHGQQVYNGLLASMNSHSS